MTLVSELITASLCEILCLKSMTATHTALCNRHSRCTANTYASQAPIWRPGLCRDFTTVPRFTSRRSTVSARSATISLNAASPGRHSLRLHDGGGYFSRRERP